nr:MAG TPA: hypothetical protein [Caudoviricetes sp.]
MRWTPSRLKRNSKRLLYAYRGLRNSVKNHGKTTWRPCVLGGFIL